MTYTESSKTNPSFVEERRVSSFRDLRVYRRAFGLQQEVFEISKTFPREETYSLVDQIRRSSRSIGANIAEAWQKRDYPAHFRSKLTDADGELAETEHWIETAHSCGYVSDPIRDSLMQTRDWVGAMLGAMKSKADEFCSQ